MPCIYRNKRCRDGREVNWSPVFSTTWTPGADGKLNTGIKFGSGSTWQEAMSFGYQSRTNWGAGNVSYFDDIIVAGTKSEVDSFLGNQGHLRFQ